MNNSSKTIVLYSSDSNPQYKKDIINVIALPENGRYRFRYKEKYISKELKEEIMGGIVGREAIVVFRTNSVDDTIDPFFVPIRMAKIESVDVIDSIYIINFYAKAYPIFSQDFDAASKSLEKNIELSRCKFCDTNTNSCFASYERFDYIIQDAGDNEKLKSQPSRVNNCCKETYEKQQENAWIRIIEALGKYEGFSGTFFFMTKDHLPEDKKRLVFREDSQKTIEIVHYNSDYKGIHSATINIRYDPSVLVSTCGETERIECRYDKNELSFMPKTISRNINSQITLDIVTDNECLTDPNKLQQETATIRIPITIKRTFKRRVLNAIFSSVGAALIGLTGLVEWNSTLEVVLFMLGSAMIGITWLLPKGE